MTRPGPAAKIAASVALAGGVLLAASCQSIIGIEDLTPCRPCYDGSADTSGQGVCRSGCLDEANVCVGQVLPAVEDCSTQTVDENCDGKLACKGDVAWTALADTFAADLVSVTAVDAAGDLIVGGTSQGKFEIDGMGSDDVPGDAFGFVAKLSHVDGKPIFVKILTATGPDTDLEVLAIAVTPTGDIVIGGGFKGDFAGASSPTTISGFVSLLDGGTGAPKWLSAQTLGDAANVANVTGVAVAADGSIAAVGNFSGSIALPDGDALTAPGSGAAGLALRLDAQGVVQASAVIGGPGASGCDNVAFGAGAEVAIACHYIGAGFTFGDTAIPASAVYNHFVFRCDSALKPTWVVPLRSAEDLFLTNVAFDPTGDRLIVAGSFADSLAFPTKKIDSMAGEYDMFVATLEADGELGWLKSYGDAAAQTAVVLAVDGAGQILIGGDFAGTIVDGRCSIKSSAGKSYDRDDAFVMKLSPTGDGIWCTSGGTSTAPETTLGLAADKVGNVFATVGFNDAFSFRGGSNVTCKPRQCVNDLAFTRLDP